jgi:hypothetical protein
MFTLNLKINENLEEFSHLQVNQLSNYEYESDDIDTLIQEICQICEENDIVNFQVRGFGQDNWPVDVAVDLASILEQLPEVICSISEEHYPFYLDFYEQGIQRRINFEKYDDFVKITCYSGTSWVPNPTSMLVTKEDMLSQFLNLKNSFIQAVKIINPKLLNGKLSTSWCNW